jgi:hypothetical protein
MCFMVGIVEKRGTGRYCQSADGPAMFRRFAEPRRRFGDADPSARNRSRPIE